MALDAEACSPIGLVAEGRPVRPYVSVHVDDGRIHEVLGVDPHLLGQRDWWPDEVALWCVS